MDNDIIPQPNNEDAIEVPALQEPPAPVSTPSRGNHFVSVPEPKIKQLTGRATQKEYDRILAAINARKRDGNTYDVVRLCLEMLDHIEDDFLQTFKTK